MSRLMKWTKINKGRGISVIDNTGTIPNLDLPPLPTSDEVDASLEVQAALEASRQAREATYEIEPSKPVLITPPAKGQVPFEVEPIDPVSFADLAGMAEVGSKEVAVEELLPPEVVEVDLISSVVEERHAPVVPPMKWDDFVASAEAQAGIPMVVPLNPTDEQLPPEVSYDGATDFPSETPIVYVSIDVPEGVEVVFKLNGQELLS